ncbi:50S ribosomal protein L6 [Paraglaciecola sp. 25GB23A]|jgi:large subunit ribosomal protein L6|uniref:50S ribosomal protein L6 n=1 Tax=Paraglaciecola sp. 25GB23A TaxID=3156068 RepID=UPI0032B0152A|tara:strand:+ start:7745 stop:8278 length:534 start_codon:yes stop_codon:yes gene_type:complete
MSRIAKAPVDIVSGVEVTIAGQVVTFKGKKGTLSRTFNDAVEIVQEENQLKTLPREGMANGWAQAGTARSLLNAMVIGVSEGFEKKLLLNGVGYRASAQGSKLNLTLGFSHPVAYEMPAGISVETPTQTEILVKGVDKQLVGQVAANIRGYRPPEPYKGKGVRLADEVVRRKEAKKK